MSKQLNMQARTALATANEVRVARAADKKLIARGQLAPGTILAVTPAHWKSATITDLFLCVPRVGRTRAVRWCELEMVTPTRLLRELTERQRLMFSRHLDVYAAQRNDVRRHLEEQLAA
ncbi:MAG: hypothetical protein M3P44_06480 [Actinomycetota bacterium]|nr:hypothetical protein [Actinomycetota bacterium]